MKKSISFSLSLGEMDEALECSRNTTKTRLYNIILDELVFEAGLQLFFVVKRVSFSVYTGRLDRSLRSTQLNYGWMHSRIVVKKATNNHHKVLIYNK